MNNQIIKMIVRAKIDMKRNLVAITVRTAAAGDATSKDLVLCRGKDGCARDEIVKILKGVAKNEVYVTKSCGSRKLSCAVHGIQYIVEKLKHDLEELERYVPDEKMEDEYERMAEKAYRDVFEDGRQKFCDLSLLKDVDGEHKRILNEIKNHKIHLRLNGYVATSRVARSLVFVGADVFADMDGTLYLAPVENFDRKRRILSHIEDAILIPTKTVNERSAYEAMLVAGAKGLGHSFPRPVRQMLREKLAPAVERYGMKTEPFPGFKDDGDLESYSVEQLENAFFNICEIDHIVGCGKGETISFADVVRQLIDCKLGY